MENYRHKGNAIYQTVKQDLKTHRKSYKTILLSLGEKDSIIHLSNDFGQLDLLIALDSIDRKIYCYLENDKARAILKNNYLTHQYSKIRIFETINEAIEQQANVLLIDSDTIALSSFELKLKNEISTLILLKSGKAYEAPSVEEYGFHIRERNDDLIILNKGND